MTHPIGIAPLTALELSPLQLVNVAAKAGYDFVGLRLVPATTTEPQYDTIGNQHALRQVTQRLADTGLHVCDIEFFRIEPATRVSDYRAAFEAGAALGARQALVAAFDPDLRRLADNFALLCELSAEYGIAANFEPMPWATVRTVTDMAAVIEASGRMDAGIVVDAIHFDRSGDDVAAIGRLPTRLWHYMQLCDAPAERPATQEQMLHHARNERLMPGDGSLDLHALVHALPADLPISLEIPMQTLARTMPALERVTHMLAKTRAVLAGDLAVARFARLGQGRTGEDG
jgi:sugar phosphate isomerase/epimerase